MSTDHLASRASSRKVNAGAQIPPRSCKKDCEDWDVILCARKFTKGRPRCHDESLRGRLTVLLCTGGGLPVCQLPMQKIKAVAANIGLSCSTPGQSVVKGVRRTRSKRRERMFRRSSNAHTHTHVREHETLCGSSKPAAVRSVGCVLLLLLLGVAWSHVAQAGYLERRTCLAARATPCSVHCTFCST